MNLSNISTTTWILILGALGVGAYYFMGKEKGVSPKIEKLQQQAEEKEKEAKRARSIVEKLQASEQARQQYEQYKEEAGAL